MSRKKVPPVESADIIKRVHAKAGELLEKTEELLGKD